MTEHRSAEESTCDGASKHGGPRSVIVHRGDGHVVLGLREEAGQDQRGDVPVHFSLSVADQSRSAAHL